MPVVFVDIDTQRDFLEPTGALFVPGSEAILGRLRMLTESARRNGIPVLATACSHAPGDPEFQVFPPHCLAGSIGQSRIPQTAWPRESDIVIGPLDGFEPFEVLPPHLTLEKREYDVFSHPEADRVVAAYDRDKPQFVVYGVATDYCVKAAVHGLLDRGCEVAVVVDAIRAIDVEHEQDVLTEFTRRGAVLTLAEIVCGEGDRVSGSGPGPR